MHHECSADYCTVASVLKSDDDTITKTANSTIMSLLTSMREELQGLKDANTRMEMTHRVEMSQLKEQLKLKANTEAMTGIRAAHDIQPAGPRGVRLAVLRAALKNRSALSQRKL